MMIDIFTYDKLFHCVSPSTFFLFWLCRMACGILVLQPGIEPTPWAVKVRSHNQPLDRQGIPKTFVVFNDWLFHHEVVIFCKGI